MLAVIIIAHVVAVCAFLFGATYDWSPLIARSNLLNRFASFGMVLSLSFLVIAVLRSGA
jgi:hypothetical protein